jgi:hypothetical protein
VVVEDVDDDEGRAGRGVRGRMVCVDVVEREEVDADEGVGEAVRDEDEDGEGDEDGFCDTPAAGGIGDVMRGWGGGRRDCEWIKCRDDIRR